VELSAVAQTSINLPFITADAAGPEASQRGVDALHLRSDHADSVERCMGPVQQAMNDAK
jgi:molecular chaperone DnaK